MKQLPFEAILIDAVEPHRGVGVAGHRTRGSLGRLRSSGTNSTPRRIYVVNPDVCHKISHLRVDHVNQ